MEGGEEIAYAGQGKGVLIHTLTEGNGMPLANSKTPANGNKREQVLPLIDKVKLKTLKRGFLYANASICLSAPGVIWVR